MVRPVQVPIVDYLVLDGTEAHLAGNRCAGCGATYLGRRNACAGCGGDQLALTPLADRGLVESFTVVHRGAPKATGPFVSVVVRLDDGVYVKANLLGVAPEAGAVDFARPVRLQTFVAGTDDDGNEAIAFGFAYEETTHG
jgi:uncharacterized OB-fold protein